MGLADNIRKAALNKTSENLPQGTNTEDNLNQLATGATGKGQSAGAGLKQSNIAEQLGMVDATNAQQQVKTEAVEAAAQIATQETEVALQKEAAESAARIQEVKLQAEKEEQTDQMLSQIEYSETQLEDREDALQLEVAASKLRLQDEKYKHELNQIGITRRIDNAAEIKKEAFRLELGEKTANTIQQLENNSALLDLRRAQTEEEKLEAINNNMAIALASIEDRNKAMKISLAKDAATVAWDVGGGNDALADYFSSEGTGPTINSGAGAQSAGTSTGTNSPILPVQGK